MDSSRSTPRFALAYHMADDARCLDCRQKHCFKCEHKPLNNYFATRTPVQNEKFENRYAKKQVNNQQSSRKNSAEIQKKGCCC